MADLKAYNARPIATSFNRSAILYQDAALMVILLDIPRSIAEGQIQCDCIPEYALLSSSPRLIPFDSTEPKTSRTREKLLQLYSQDHLRWHESIRESARQALESIKASKVSVPWCSERAVLHKISSWEPSIGSDSWESFLLTTQNPHVVLSPCLNSFFSSESINKALILNPDQSSTILQIAPNFRYRIPPGSAFVLGDVCTTLTSTSSASKLLLPPDQYHEAGEFDFILLDPPWHNRSVRRSRTYSTPGHSVDFVLKTLESFLKQHLAADGSIGIWVTNREAIKKATLASMDRCGLELYEEWVWLKVTAQGDPVSPLEGLWRQPYEIFMIFRKPTNGNPPVNDLSGINSSKGDEVQRRVIVAVPDVHSRKPCLKEALESALLKPGRKRVLEVFARNLTTGWWSWGDEVLKFNWEGHWVRRADASEA